MADSAFFFHSPLIRSQAPVYDLIRNAMRKLGIIDSARPLTADEARDGLNDLNGLLEQWSLESLNVYRVGQIILTTIPGQTSYKIGPGEYIDADRPASIEEAKDLDNLHAPIEVIEYATVEDFSGRIISYDPDFPSASITLAWEPTGEKIALKVNQELRRYETTNEPHGLPPGFQRALELALAIAIAPDYDVSPGQSLVAQAATAKRTIRTIASRLRIKPVKTGIGRINRGFPFSFSRGY